MISDQENKDIDNDKTLHETNAIKIDTDLNQVDLNLKNDNDLIKHCPHLNNYNIVTSQNLVEIDGSILEGGGQILRISIFLSILFRKNLKVYNIRGKRSNPGLQRQHLAATSAITSLTQSKLEGAKIGSKEILITPGSVNDIPLTETKCDCNSAGSIGLLIQQILPCVIYAKDVVSIELVGGTVVSHAPSTFYIEDVLTHILKEKMGLEFSIDVKRHGLYPTGGGVVNFTSTPVNYIKPINITKRGKLKKVSLKLASTSNFQKFNPTQTIKEINKQVKKQLRVYFKDDDCNLDDIFTYKYIKLYSPKNAFTIFASITLTFDNTIICSEQLYSEKKEIYDQVTKFESEIFEKFEDLLHKEHICLDEFTVDHLIIFMALAKGRSKISLGEVSKHTLTALEIVRNFVPSIEVNTFNGDQHTVIEIEGIGWHNEN